MKYLVLVFFGLGFWGFDFFYSLVFFIVFGIFLVLGMGQNSFMGLFFSDGISFFLIFLSFVLLICCFFKFYRLLKF